MMNPTAETRDAVLYRFHIDCPSPTAADVVTWTERFPAFAEDIRAHAAIARDWAAEDAGQEAEVDELALQRARSRALNLIYSSDETPVQSTAVGFWKLVESSGTTLPAIAKKIGISRGPVSDLFNGWMKPPIGGRFAHAIMNALGLDQAGFDRELLFALANPRLGEAKAAGPPEVLQRSYQDSIDATDMPPDLLSYWLEDE